MAVSLSHRNAQTDNFCQAADVGLFGLRGTFAHDGLSFGKVRDGGMHGDKSQCLQADQ